MNSDYYLDFENKFRGDREKIFNIFSSYEPLIDLSIEDKTKPVLIDVGCGRGEWLQRCQNKFYKSIGIESDINMAQVCRDNGLFIIEGDAINELTKFDNDSVSVITIFHVIEHLEFDRLQELITQCHRILNEDGILIIETPSIDNLIVSTKTFYVDHTHINHINLDSISFQLEKSGFSSVQHYYLNGGPLQNASPLKVTRILNGVAQDLCIISTKTTTQFNKIIANKNQWISSLNIGLTLFEAATEFDLKLEALITSIPKSLNNHDQTQRKIKLMQEEISLLNDEISLLKSKLKIFIYLYKSLKKIKQILLYIFVYLKSILKKILNKIFSLILNQGFIRDFLTSEDFNLIVLSLLKLLGKFSNSKVGLIRNKLKQILDNNRRYIQYNKKLFFHYEQSNKSKEYLDLLSRKYK